MSEWLLVPQKPTDKHIESLAMRLDHGHGIRSIAWPITNPPTMETDEQFAMRQEANRATARKLYEEATGQGFYKIDGPKPVAWGVPNSRITERQPFMSLLHELPKDGGVDGRRKTPLYPAMLVPLYRLDDQP